MASPRQSWQQVPCAPKYEISNRGVVRNIKTGKIIKPWMPKNRKNGKQVSLRIETGGKAKKFHVSSLLWLTHGVIPKRETYLRIAVPVIISHGNERYYFDSIRQAAQFLARREHYSVSGVRHHLSKRREELKDWRINYQR